jgi:hypothetical protein
MRICSALKISLLSALAGWGTGFLYCCLAWLLTGAFVFDRGTFAIFLWSGIFVGVIVFGIWLFALLPLAIFIPRRSFLWKVGVLIPMGFLAGLAIATAGVMWNAIRLEADWPSEMYDWHVNFVRNLFYLGPPAAMVGLSTCLTGALLNRQEMKSFLSELPSCESQTQPDPNRIT